MENNDQPLLVKGIIGAVLAFTPVSIAGFILGLINNGAIKKYLAAGGAQTGKVKAASITTKVAIIAGIIMTIFYIIYWVAVVGLAALNVMAN